MRRTHAADDEVVLEPPDGSPQDGVSPDLLFLKVDDDKVVKNRCTSTCGLRIKTPTWLGFLGSALDALTSASRPT